MKIATYQSFEKAVNDLSDGQQGFKRKFSKTKQTMLLELERLGTTEDLEWFKGLDLRKTSVMIESFTDLQSKIIRVWNDEILSRPILEVFQSLMNNSKEGYLIR